MRDPLRLVLIGAGGRIASDWLAVARATASVRVTALVDADPAAATRLGQPVCADIDALLAGTLLTEDRPDAAILATPPSTHEPIATALLSAGVHVLCEKPLALDVAEATRMLRTARAAERTLMMASKFRFVDDVAAARQRIVDGVIGRPVFYDNAFCSEVDMTGRWNSTPRLSGGGVLIDSGAHAIDLARCLIGDIDRVLAAFGPRLQELRVEDSVRVLLAATDGALGRADLSWSVSTGSPAYAAIHGSSGSIELGWRGARLRVGDTWSEFGTGYDKRRAFQTQLSHFVDVIRGRAEPRIGDHDALESVRFVAAAQRSIEAGRWIRLAEVDS